MKANKFLRDNGLTKCSRIVDDLTEQGVDSDFTKDLKHLVESWQLVQDYGGVSKAKDFISPYSVDQLSKKVYSPMLRLKQAIADVEEFK